MLVDVEALEVNSEVSSEVCIIGAGAAGISIARALSRSGLDVVLLEAGTYNPVFECQNLYKGQMAHVRREEDVYYPLRTRMRFFGGSTNAWYGWCMPLDTMDFEKRDWVPYSGWPITREDLEPWYRKATKTVEIEWFKDLSAWNEKARRPLIVRNHERVVSKMWQVSPPTRFGVRYRKQIEKSKNVRLILNANVTAIRAHPDLKQVDYLNVSTLEGRKFKVRSRYFVLATGGIENARLLLSSDEEQAGGLGNANDLVGRFFSDHPETLQRAAQLVWVDPSLVTEPSRLSMYVDQKADPLLKGTRNFTAFALSDSTLRQEKLLQFSLQLLGLGKGDLDELGEAVGKTAARLDHGTRRERGRSEYLQCSLAARAEPVPNPENRVTLLEERDALGMRRVRVAWDFSDLDLRSHERGMQIVAEELGRAGLARLKVVMPLGSAEKPLGTTHGAAHHMGTTRMHSDPKQGVVDANCRVHGLANLFVAGSSVFPTFGLANPTLTLIALALRTAGHLRDLVRG
jgi:choline dehydrogenase-like flavoprotein